MNAPSQHLSIIDTYAHSRHMERAALEAVMFRIIMPDKATKEDLIGFLQLAYRFDLDPWAREIFCIVNRGKIQPYISIDGYAKIVNRQEQYDGCSFEYTQDNDGHIDAVTCIMHRKDRGHPTIVTEFFDECVVDAQPGRGPGPWQKSPSRMLRHRAFIQAARLSFGITAALDEGGEGVILDAEAMPALEPESRTAPVPPKRTPPPAPNGKPKQRQEDDPGQDTRGFAEDERRQHKKAEPKQETTAHDPETGELFEPEAFLTELDERLNEAKNFEQLGHIWKDFEVNVTLVAHPDHKARAADLLKWHQDRLAKLMEAAQKAPSA